MLTQARLKELFDYDPSTGWFTNRASRGRALIGDRAGSITSHGYVRIIIDYRKYYAHHLAWFYVHGTWASEIDHIDGNGFNNIITNLRLCTRTQNNFNSQRSTGESGLRGAYLDKRNLQWYSKIQLGGQVTFLGNFNTPEEAHEAFMAAVDLHHGEFALHKRPLGKPSEDTETWQL